jgi:hypothetical protein
MAIAGLYSGGAPGRGAAYQSIALKERIMASRMVLVCLGIAVLSSCVRAQDPMTAPATVGQLKQALEENNAAMRAEIKTAIAEALALRDKTQESSPAPLTPPGTLEERVEILEKLAANHDAQLNQIVTMSEPGQYRVRFDTTPQKAALQQGIRNLAPQEGGTFVINNRTPWIQTLYVNGTPQYVQPGQVLPVVVRPGTVMSWLPGQQRLTWHIGAPDFKQTVELLPRQPEYVAGWASY